jgi:hypothetical protein
VNVLQRVPGRGELALEQLVAELTDPARRPAAPFCPKSLRFCAEYSDALFSDPQARRQPEVQALAYRLRGGELKRLERRFHELQGDGLLVPRGLAFHVPPGNVGTMFAYSWVYALLAGNASVLRLPSRPSPAVEAALAPLAALLAKPEHEGVARSVWMLSYGHEESVNEAISRVSDLRVIWGGDETVRRLRALPSPPLCKDLAFPDRWSLCAVRASAYLRLEPALRRALAERFYNDTYWFEQQACSSPRLIVWVGSPGEGREAGEAFFAALDAVLEERGETVPVGSALRKLSFSVAAVLDQPVAGHRGYGSRLTVLPLAGLERLSRRHCGAGLFYEATLPALEGLLPHIRREDQTLTHFGFSLAELESFARALAGRGLNRMVPVGEALSFGRFWDGYDLLAEMTQRVHVQA